MQVSIVLTAALSFHLGSIGAEVTGGPSIQFCLKSPKFSEFQNKYLGIRIGRFVIGASISAHASKSLGVGAQAVASSSTGLCVGIHFGIGAIASAEVKLAGVWYITEPPSNVFWDGM